MLGAQEPVEAKPILRVLQQRSEFLAVAGTRKRCATAGLVLQVAKRRNSDTHNLPATHIGIGYTASKKVGNAVCRNRAKRRLRALANELLPLHGTAGNNYVAIARATTIDRPFDALRKDFLYALKRLSKPHDARSDSAREDKTAMKQ